MNEIKKEVRRMLKGKTAVITGAGGGIGKAVVEVFAQNGADIWACAHNQNKDFEEYLNKTALENHVLIQPVYFDLLNTDEIKKAVKTITRHKKNIDILVNNAGIAQYDAFIMMSIDTLKNIFNVNYIAPIELTQFFIRRMKPGSAITFVSSIAGLEAVSGNTAYGGSKAAIVHTTKVLSKELAAQGIRVNAVAPGMVNTSMKLKADEGVWNDLIARTSLKRAAEPEEIANVICCLSSDLSSYVNGQVVRVDGGMN